MSRSAWLALDLMSPTRILDPLQVLSLPRDLARRGLENAWDLGLQICRAAGKRLSQGISFLAQAVVKSIKSGIGDAMRQIQDDESSDPQDQRELVAMPTGPTPEVFTGEEERLDALQPVQAALELPDGCLYTLRPILITLEAIQEAVQDLDDACREAAKKIRGRSIERSNESLFEAETLFRAGYGLKLLEQQELDLGWSERLGRLHQQIRNLIQDRALGLADRPPIIQEPCVKSDWREEMSGKPLESPIEEPQREKPRELERPAIQRNKGGGGRR